MEGSRICHCKICHFGINTVQQMPGTLTIPSLFSASNQDATFSFIEDGLLSAHLQNKQTKLIIACTFPFS